MTSYCDFFKHAGEDTWHAVQPKAKKVALAVAKHGPKLGVSSFKAFSMSLTSADLALHPFIKTEDVPSGLLHLNPVAYAFAIVTGAAFLCDIYMKYQQTTSRAPKDVDDDEEKVAFAVNGGAHYGTANDEDGINATRSKAYLAPFAGRMVAGSVFSVTDLILYARLIFLLSNPGAIGVIITLGFIPALIQDISLSLGCVPPEQRPDWFNRAVEKWADWQKTSWTIWGNGVLGAGFRTIAAKISLYYAWTASFGTPEVSLVFLYLCIALPFSAYNKYSNYLFEKRELEPAGIVQSWISSILGSLFTLDYTLEDSTQYVMAFFLAYNLDPGYLVLGYIPAVALAIAPMFLLEIAAYFPKTYTSAKEATQVAKETGQTVIDKTAPVCKSARGSASSILSTGIGFLGNKASQCVEPIAPYVNCVPITLSKFCCGSS